jgi:hypothetical protein
MFLWLFLRVILVESFTRFSDNGLNFHTNASSFCPYSRAQILRAGCACTKCKQAEPAKIKENNVDAADSAQTCES